jgi:ketosteroid isomerase-like protein
VTKPLDVARAELLALYEEWFARVGPEPGDFFARVLADDWVYIDFLGVRRAKADYEPYIAGVAPGSGPRAPRDLEVRVLGDIAIVHGSYEIAGGAVASDTTLRFTAVWQLRDRSWVALAHHTSAVADPRSPS